jgi:hypothetical protein
MTDTKIQRLRGIAAWLDVADWTNMAANVREAASELERLGKIEAAAIRVYEALRVEDSDVTFDAVDSLAETIEANPCPIGATPERRY